MDLIIIIILCVAMSYFYYRKMNHPQQHQLDYILYALLLAFVVMLIKMVMF
mgnify:CR=1 FL=1